MTNFKKGSLPFRYEIFLSQDQCQETTEEIEDIIRVRNGSSMYVILCQISIMQLGLVSRYKPNPNDLARGSKKACIGVLKKNSGLYASLPER